MSVSFFGKVQFFDTSCTIYYTLFTHAYVTVKVSEASSSNLENVYCLTDENEQFLKERHLFPAS